MSSKELILHPCNAFATNKDLSLLIEQLQSDGFLGNPFDFYGEINYRQGANIFDFLTFESSHQTAVLEKTDNGIQISHVLDSKNDLSFFIRPISASPEVLISPLVDEINPTCPNCGYAVIEKIDAIDEWYHNKADYRWMCPNCQTSSEIFELDWKHTAAFARYAIQIRTIMPAEAYPNQKLLNKLKSYTGHDWSYIYSWI